MTINLSRRGVLATPAALLIASCGGIVPVAARPPAPCPWLALAAEREAIFHHVSASSLVNGNVPDDVADAAWRRVSEIDAEIAATAPASPAGTAAVLRHFAWEISEGSSPDDDGIVSAMRAAADMLEGLAS